MRLLNLLVASYSLSAIVRVLMSSLSQWIPMIATTTTTTSLLLGLHVVVVWCCSAGGGGRGPCSSVFGVCGAADAADSVADRVRRRALRGCRRPGLHHHLSTSSVLSLRSHSTPSRPRRQLRQLRVAKDAPQPAPYQPASLSRPRSETQVILRRWRTP